MGRRHVMYALASVLTGITALAASQPANAAGDLSVHGQIRNVATDSRWALDGNYGKLVDTVPRGNHLYYDSAMWDVETSWNGYTTIRNAKTNECLDAATAGVNQYLYTSECTGSRTQQWDFTNVGYGHFVISPRSRGDLVVSVADDSNVDYSHLWLKPRTFHDSLDSVFYLEA